MAKLESLIVDLQLNNAELKKSIDEANTKLEQFGKKLNDLAGVITFEKIGGAALNALKSVVQFTMRGAELADRFGEMAQSAGMSVEEISRLNYAASTAGVSTEQLGVAMSKLNKAMVEASTGGKEQAALFGALGVKVTDASGKLRSTNAVFTDVADRLSSFKDGAAKSALAIQLFGKSGAELIPLLNEGSAGLKRMADEADRLGITVSTSAAAAADQFGDNVVKLEAAFASIGQQTAAQLTPALAELTDQLLKSRDGTSSLHDAATLLATGLKLVVSAVIVGVGVFEALGKSIAAAASAAYSLATGNLDGVADLFKNQYEGAADAASNAVERLKAVWAASDDAAKKAASSGGEAADKLAAKLATLKKAAVESEQAMKQLTSVAEDLEKKVAEFDASPLEALERRMDSGDLADKLAKIGSAADDMKLRILAAANSLEQLREAKLNTELELARELKMAGVREDARRRTADYNLFTPGMTDRRATELRTTGFKDFEDAMAKYVAATNSQTKAMADAQFFKLRNELDAANASELMAAEFGRAASDAERAASGFEKLREIDWQAAHAKLEKMTSAIGALAGQLVSKLGDLGSVIQSGIQGFQQGGWWGAIIAVIIELFSRFERFSEIIELGNSQLMQVIDQLKPALEMLTDGFLQFMKMSGVLTRIIFQIIQPIIEIFSRALDKVTRVLTPILSLVSTLLEPIQTITDSLFGIADAMGILDGVIKGIAFVFNGISLSVLAVMYGLYSMWGWVLGAVRDVMKFFLLDTTELEQTIATHSQKTQEIRDRMDRISRNMTDPNANANDATPIEPLDTSGAQVDIDVLGNSAHDAATSLDRFTQELTNVPEGFKYQLRAYQSMDTVQGASFIDGPDITINVNGSLIREGELKEWLRNLFGRDGFRSTGTPLTGNYR